MNKIKLASLDRKHLDIPVFKMLNHQIPKIVTPHVSNMQVDQFVNFIFGMSFVAVLNFSKS